MNLSAKICMGVAALCLAFPIVLAENIHAQFERLAADADYVEIVVRPQLAVALEANRIAVVRKEYRGAALLSLVSHLEFYRDGMSEAELRKEAEKIRSGKIVRLNCDCDGSHVIRFWKAGAVIEEVGYAHGTHLKSPKLDGGHDAYLTEKSSAWLRNEIGWTQLCEEIEAIRLQKKMRPSQPNQPPLRMPVSGTPAADAPVAPPPGIAGR